MKLKYFRLKVDGAPRRFIIDREHSARVSKFNWCWMQVAQRAWAVITPGRPRMMLHRFIALRLMKREWVEVWFANGDPFDCTSANLVPYRRSEEGALRRWRKRKSNPTKGVYFKKSTKRWGAMIKHKGKLRHLGYFATSAAAAGAYARAWRLAHPGLVLPKN